MKYRDIMRVFEWKNKRVTKADLFLVIEECDNEIFEKLFPRALEVCASFHGSNEMYAFVNREEKTFIPMKRLSYAFGGQYNGYPPYGNELFDVKIDFDKLTWQEEVELDIARRI